MLIQRKKKHVVQVFFFFVKLNPINQTTIRQKHLYFLNYVWNGSVNLNGFTQFCYYQPDKDLQPASLALLAARIMMEMRWNLSSDQLGSESSAAPVVIGLVQLVSGFGAAPETVANRAEVDWASDYLIPEPHSQRFFFLSLARTHTCLIAMQRSRGGIHMQTMHVGDFSLYSVSIHTSSLRLFLKQKIFPDCLPSFFFVLDKTREAPRGAVCVQTRPPCLQIVSSVATLVFRKSITVHYVKKVEQREQPPPVQQVPLCFMGFNVCKQKDTNAERKVLRVLPFSLLHPGTQVHVGLCVN